jgi:hypothetical protein
LLSPLFSSHKELINFLALWKDTDPGTTEVEDMITEPSTYGD